MLLHASKYPRKKLNIQSRKSFQMPLSQNERIPDIPMEFWQLLNCFMHVIGEMIMELQSRQIAIHRSITSSSCTKNMFVGTIYFSPTVC